MKKPPSISTTEAQQVLSYIMGRARTDAVFRRNLLDNPRTTLEEEFDFALPESFNIRFVENLGADLTVVLPDLDDSGSELSDEDLGYVAGGATEWISVVLTESEALKEAWDKTSCVPQVTF